MKKISFVIPCYRSEKTIEKVAQEIIEVVNKEKYCYEIVLVNDYSPDATWKVIAKMCEKNQCIKGINLAKNFGQASAVMAGYRACSGDYVVTMDDDGQSPVDEINDMLELLVNKDYDVVYGICEQAKFNVFRSLGSKVNAWMANVMYGRPKDKRIVSINIAQKFVIDEVIKYQNPYTYMSGLFFRTTRNMGYKVVNHRERQYGNSGYTLMKLIKVWMNGFTAFSIKPLQFASVIGFVTSALGALLGIYTIIRKLVWDNIAVGWSSTISIMLFLGGVILLVLGMIGEYIGRIYMCINMTPQYVIREEVNFESEINGEK